MQAEVEKATAQINTLKRKSKDDGDRYNELEQRKSKELAAMNKQCEDTSKKVRQLENLNENLRKKLDRKTEEIAALSKRLKESASTLSIGQRGSKVSLVHEASKMSLAADASFDASQVVEEPQDSIVTGPEMEKIVSLLGPFINAFIGQSN